MTIKCLFLFVFFCSSITAQIQDNIFFCGYGSNTMEDKLCDHFQNSFTSNSEAEKAVKNILTPLGLPANFILVPCNSISNAVAVTPKDGLRYILYDPVFLNRIKQVTTDWSALSILAHEIGHHLAGHTTSGAETLADQRKMELEADEFSGFVMAKLGASLNEAQSAIGLLAIEGDDKWSTHPNKSKRLNAIRKGFDSSERSNKEDKNTNRSSRIYELYSKDELLSIYNDYFSSELTIDEYYTKLNNLPEDNEVLVAAYEMLSPKGENHTILEFQENLGIPISKIKYYYSETEDVLSYILGTRISSWGTRKGGRFILNNEVSNKNFGKGDELALDDDNYISVSVGDEYVLEHLGVKYYLHNTIVGFGDCKICRRYGGKIIIDEHGNYYYNFKLTLGDGWGQTVGKNDKEIDDYDLIKYMISNK